MIYLGLVLDYFINLISPLNSYFIIYNIDKNKFVDVVIVGLILDFIYNKFLFNLIILILLYFLAKIIKVKRKYLIFKNLALFLVYFNLSYFIFNFYIYNYFITFIGGILTYFIYIFLVKKYEICI